jgi:hypothetical protein
VLDGQAAARLADALMKLLAPLTLALQLASLALRALNKLNPREPGLLTPIPRPLGVLRLPEVLVGVEQALI